MTIKELEQILIDEKVRKGDYSLSDSQPIIYDGFLIRKGDHGNWLLYYMERGQKDLLATCDKEHKACIEFLKLMATEDKQLQKYIPKSEVV